MERNTRNLINNLYHCENQEDMLSLVHSEHQRIKSLLLKEGIKFHNEKDIFSQDIQGGQTVYDQKSVECARSYEEINYIRNGLSKKWVTMIDEMERYEPIKGEVQEISDSFD